MKVTNTNINFSGNLYFKKPYLWTEKIKDAISNSKKIQDKLADNDIVAKIAVKKEKRIPPYTSLHLQGDNIYKVKLIIKKEPKNFLDKIKNIFDNKKIKINKHYHSEITTIKRISNL